MAQNVTVAGASYSAVPAVDLPKTGGGTATFTDTSPTTAVESDVASGKIFFKADGSQATGTAVEYVDGDNLTYGSDRTSPIVGTGQAGYMVI